MINNKIKGTGVALITPFNIDYSIDYSALKNIIDFTIRGGVDFLVILGTTGESPVISIKERNELLAFCKDVIDSRVPIVIGLGGNNTLSLIDEIQSIDLNGIDAILSVAPYYNKPNQDGIYLHYKLIAENSSLPVILYNVPSRTGVNISSKTTLRLANDFTNIIAIKEASGDLRQIKDIIKNKPKNFLVLSGDDGLTEKMIKMGADGVIAVIAQAFPEIFSQMVNMALSKQYNHSRKLDEGIREIYSSLYHDGNPAGIKATLNILGLCNNILRPPLTPVSSVVYSDLKELTEIINQAVT